MQIRERSDFMRLRNLKDKDELVKNCDYLVTNKEEYKGLWKEVFGNDKPIHLEIGMGKGDFIYHMAEQFPEINFIGIEKYTGVIARAIKKYPKKLANLRIINMDALDLDQVFSKEIDVIYLNFSDPWPKEKHAKRRLTSEIFLAIYDKVFKRTAKIIMKTDNIGLFASSLVSLSNYGYKFQEVNLDLASSDSFNVVTEYEAKFRSKGIKINYLVAKKNPS